jgi:hypothetical protein
MAITCFLASHPLPLCCSMLRFQGVVVYFIDLFDNDAATVAAMRNMGLVPVCYFR